MTREEKACHSEEQSDVGIRPPCPPGAGCFLVVRRGGALPRPLVRCAAGHMGPALQYFISVGQGPCALPGVQCRGITDCHSQCAHWLRNDIFLQGVRWLSAGGVEPRPYAYYVGVCCGRTEASAPTGWQDVQSKPGGASAILAHRRANRFPATTAAANRGASSK